MEKMLQKNEKGLTRYGSKATLTHPIYPMSTQIENPAFDNSHFQNLLPQIYRTVLNNFRKIVQSIIFLHAFFIVLIGAELAFLLPFIATSAMTALALGALFFTGFSYLVLYFYFQARKPERILHLKEIFLQSCARHISAPVGEAQHHLSIAEALIKLASYLEDFEKHFYRLPPFLQFLNPAFSWFSTHCYWKDVFKLKQFLIAAAIEEHLKQIRATPTDLEVHASLATTYVAQSKIYRMSLRSQKDQTLFEENFRSSARLAIEEFRILNHYAPNDPWVHEQLAQGYHELEMPEEELGELETLLKLRPQDKETLYRLGQLYFLQGMNAKGLQIYEKLKQSNFKQAEDLIASYGLQNTL
jgi:tetratricopeptide (TPR) repeat protein